MQKDVTLCKDCLYRGSGLCPVKTKEWVLTDDSFCFAGQEKPKIETGSLLQNVNNESDYLLVVGTDGQEYPETVFAVYLDGHETLSFREKELLDYIVLGKFPYSHCNTER